MIFNLTERETATKQNADIILENIKDIQMLLNSKKLTEQQKTDFISADLKNIKNTVNNIMDDNFNLQNYGG